MKNSKIFTLCMFLCMGTMLLTTSSCSKDDAPKNEENPNGTITAPFQTSLFAEKIPELPKDLNSFTDPHAVELVNNFEEVTTYADNKDIMTIPPGSVLSHTPVTPDGGRPANLNNAVATDYTVYTYTVTSGGETFKMIYQFSVQNGMDVFELFMSSEKIGTVKWFEIRQSQDGKSGTMTSSLLGVTAFTWTWEIQPDGEIFITYSYGSGDYKSTWKLHYNEDMSGNMKLYSQGQLTLEYTWDATGHGTYINYIDGTNGSW